jgi:hypothetical protein
VTLERYSDIVTGIYAPIIALVAEGPAPVSKAIYRYGEFWAELIPGGL